MRVYVTLLVIAGLGLALPLCSVIASRGAAGLVLDRTHDSARLAAVAEASVIAGSAGVMTGELAVYESVYDIQGLVLDRDAQIVAASHTGLTLEEVLAGTAWASGPESEVPGVVRNALAGNRPGAADTIWPWDRGRLIVAEPVVSSGEIIGVVLTSSPTEALRRSTMVQWAWVVAVVVGLLAMGIAAAVPLARWVLRPIGHLDAASTALSQGSLDARVSVDAGPPELRHLGESFNAMAETITSMLERQRTFVAFAGHQVRNPLAALRLRVEALGSQLDAPARAEHAMALEEVDRLSRTCDSLLTLARADADEVDRVAVRLDQIAERRVQAWWPIAHRAQARLRVAATEEIWWYAAEGTLEQTLDALIDNSLKFGGRGVTVEIEVRTAGDGAQLLVRDNGPGLSAEQRRDAVQPFWRGPREASALAAGGSGLGLSVVVTLLELQGGRLELRPGPGGGVEAVVHLAPITEDRSRT